MVIPTTGLVFTDNLTSVPNPVALQTHAILITDGQLYRFDGPTSADWTQITGGGGAVSQGPITTSGLTQATARLLGRNTASTGAIEEITLGTNLSFSGTTLNASGGAGGAASGARVFRGTNQSISAATNTPISFSAEVYDQGGYWVIGSPTVLTVPTTGYYHCNCSVHLSALGYIQLTKNGTDPIATAVAAAAGSDFRSCCATDIDLSSGDTISVVVFIQAGGNVVSDANSSPILAVHLIGT